MYKRILRGEKKDLPLPSGRSFHATSYLLFRVLLNFVFMSLRYSVIDICKLLVLG